jgi:hypothetical protein
MAALRGAAARLSALLVVGALAKTAVYVPPQAGVLDPVGFLEWITSSAAAGYDTLELQRGTYNVTQAAGSAAHVVLTGPLNGVTIDFRGSTLQLQQRAGGAFYVAELNACAVLNVTVHWAVPTSNTAAVVAIDPAGLYYDVAVPPGHPEEDFAVNTVSACSLFDGSLADEPFKTGAGDLYVTNTTALGAPGSYRLHFGGSVLPPNGNATVGDWLGCRTSGSHGFVVDGCEATLFQDVTLYGGGCFAFFHTAGNDAPGGRGGNTFRRIAVRRPGPIAPSQVRPMLSSSADGFHCAGSRRGPVIEDSHLERMPDDGIALHGQYTIVTDSAPVVGPGQVVVQAVNGYRDDFATGDRVLLYRPEFLPTDGVGAGYAGPAVAAPPAPTYPHYFTVSAVAAAPAGYTPPSNASRSMPSLHLTGPYRVLTLAQALPPGVGFDWILTNAERKCSGFALRGNTIAQHRARGMLIKASDGVIQGNVINGSTSE